MAIIVGYSQTEQLINHTVGQNAFCSDKWSSYVLDSEIVFHHALPQKTVVIDPKTFWKGAKLVHRRSISQSTYSVFLNCRT